MPGSWNVANWPIQRKLLLIIMAAVALSLLLVMIGIFAYEITTYRSRLAQRVSELGAFIEANSAPALAFDDAETAREILHTLQASPEVAVAALYGANRRLFASYIRQGRAPVSVPSAPAAEGIRYIAGHLEFVRSVQARGRTLGTLFIRADQIAVYDRLTDYTGIVAVLLLAVGGGALLLQRLLQRLVSDPLLTLAGTAESIAGGDLSIRFPVRSADEMGQMAAAFNHMTSQLARSYEVLREREEQLRRSETTLRLAIEATGLGTFDFYPRTRQLLWSDLAKLHFGLSPAAQADYHTFLEGMHPEDRERVLEMVQRALQPGGDGAYRAEYRTVGIEDGKERWLVARGQVLHDEGGEALRLVGATLDITERKEAERELRQAKDELEARVLERTEALTTALLELRAETEERLHAVDALRSREQMLMQQNRLAAMGEMLANISHQWRQPLNVVGLLLQDLTRSYERGTFSRETLTRSVGRARELISHLSQTIDDFRNYLKPDRTQLPFNVREVVEKTLSMFQESLKEIRVELHAPEGEEIVVTGYRNDYAQALMNILVNARDVFRERGVTDPALTVRISKEGGRSVVTVADNAGGIPEEVIGRIFEPYFTTKAPDKGTGIGLYMSKTIIEKNMSGSLTARNSGAGAEFRIEV